MSAPVKTTNPYQEFLVQHSSQSDEFTETTREALRRACESYMNPASEDTIALDRLEENTNHHRDVKGLGDKLNALTFAGHLIDESYLKVAKELFLKIIDLRLSWKYAGCGQGKAYQDWMHAFSAGVFLIRSAYAYLRMDHLFSEAEEAKVKAYYNEYLDYYAKLLPLKDERWPACNRSCYIRITMSLLADICLSKGWQSDEKLFRELSEEGVFRGKLFLRHGHNEGNFSEGPAYGCVSLDVICDYAWFRQLWFGDEELMRDENWDLIVEALARQHVPGSNQLLPFNDSDPEVGMYQWLMWVAVSRKNSLAYGLWKRLAGNQANESYSQYMGALNIYLSKSWLFSQGAKLDEEVNLPQSTTKFYKESGMLLFKSGWGDRDTFFSFMNDARSADGRHMHADRNHFNLYALGETFAMDSGYTRDPLPYAFEELRIGSLGEAHNLPTFHGSMQRIRGAAPEGITEVALNELDLFVEGEAGHSYEGVERFTRRAVLCRTGSPHDQGILVIADAMVSPEGDDGNLWISWLLHTHASNHVQIMPEKLRIVGGRHGNLCEVSMTASWMGRWREDTFHDHPRLRYEWFAPSPASSLCVFAPHHRSEKAPAVETLRHDSGCRALITQGEHRHLFLSAKAGQKLSWQGFETESEFAFWHLVNDEVIQHIER